MIKFYFSDGTHQVLRPTAAFFNHVETEIDYTKWVNGKRHKRKLTLEERVSKIASDLKAINFEIC